MTGKFTKEERLLATHISDNKEFENACLTGDADKIMSIIKAEMSEHNLHTKGSIKLHNDILSMTKGKTNIAISIGREILAFVWNSRLSGTGLAVC